MENKKPDKLFLFIWQMKELFKRDPKGCLWLIAMFIVFVFSVLFILKVI